MFSGERKLHEINCFNGAFGTLDFTNEIINYVSQLAKNWYTNKDPDPKILPKDKPYEFY